MKSVHKHLMVAGLLAALAMAAGAQAPPVSPQPVPGDNMGREAHSEADRARMQQHMARMHERIRERMAQRQAALKEKLQLSPSQEGAWNSYVSALMPPANFQRHDRADFARLTTPERIERMQALRAQRIAEMDRRAEATKTFYAALSPQQKKVFDDATARWDARRHDGRRHEHGWGDHDREHRRG